MHRFDPNRYYQTDDQALLLLGRRATLTRWRHENRGPPYVRLSGRVLYRGQDLNAYLDSHVVKTRDERGGRSAGPGM